MNTEIEQYLKDWNTTGTDRRTYKVPSLFYSDHIDRNCGKTDRVISSSHNIVTVEMDYAGYMDLLSDAQYYWQMRDEVCDADLARSAKRTIAALNKHDHPIK